MKDWSSASLAAVVHDGERHLPTFDPESPNHYRHMTAYHFALGFARGAEILDYGCGTGYGPNLLWRRGGARSILAFDSSPEAIAYCRAAYPDLADAFRIVEPGSVPLPDRSSDVVLLLQAIEHVSDDQSLVRELHRVLRPGGVLLVTTPNVAATYGDPLHPENPHHVREYDRRSLLGVCGREFAVVQELAVHASLRAGGRGLGLERSILYRAARRLRRYLVSPLYVAPISLADFAVSAYQVEESMDLLFVCRRTAP